MNIILEHCLCLILFSIYVSWCFPWRNLKDDNKLFPEAYFGRSDEQFKESDKVGTNTQRSAKCLTSNPLEGYKWAPPCTLSLETPKRIFTTRQHLHCQRTQETYPFSDQKFYPILYPYLLFTRPVSFLLLQGVGRHV